MNIVPSTRPRLSSAELNERIKSFDLNREKYPLFIVGIRGYYLNSMGKPGVNDRGIYDDALFIVTPNVFAAFNANLDPSVYRDGIATILPGVYFAHKFDTHRGRFSHYPAICQRLAPVKVLRDGGYIDTGMFGINFHKGGRNSTSSEGCQTLHPDQWIPFYELAKSEAVRLYDDFWDQRCIPYILLEN